VVPISAVVKGPELMSDTQEGNTDEPKARAKNSALPVGLHSQPHQ